MECQTVKAHLLWIAALCGLTLGSCSEAEKPLDPSGQAPTPSAGENSLLERFAQARQMSTTAPISPAKHFRLLGKITFHTANSDIEQDAELWLAGPHRMSFQLGTGGLLNDFRLFDAEHCWLKPAGGEFADYDPAELLTETILRWEVLRFPWGWEEALAATKLASADDLGVTLEKHSLQGPILLETDRNGLPKRVKLAGSSLALGDWKPAEQPQSLVPSTWQWQYQTGKRSEVFSSIRGHALFQDNAFRPVQGKNLTVDRLVSALDQDPSLGDEFGVMNLTLHYLQEKEHADFQGALVRGRWWQVGEQRYFVAALEEPQPSSGWRTSSNTMWLRWSTYANTSAADGIKSLTAVMAQTGFHATGDCWALLPPDGERNYRRVFLMPVAKD
jgi:hypothetical protein